MAYVGTTGATTLQNVPRLLVPAMSGPLAANSTSVARRGAQLWTYNTSDGSTNLMDVGYFTDGDRLGMKMGDLLFALCWSTQSATGWVTVTGALFSSNTTAGFNLSTGCAITSTYN